MYRISYEKCVCFIFLVILAVLSCSGFRIDNLAMTDISKRNFHTSSSSFNVRSSPSVETITPTYRHKIRHHRQLRAQAHNSHRPYEPQKPPTGHIDVQVFPPHAVGFPPTTRPNEHFAQIPSTDIHHPLFPTRPIVTRSQRSPDNKTRPWQYSREEDISMKAFKAQIVVLAQAKGGSTSSCVFNVDKTYKNTNQFPVNGKIRLEIPCDKDEKSHKSKNLVKNKLHLGNYYILFLNESNVRNYSLVASPKLIKPNRKKKFENIEKVIRRVCEAKFVPMTPKIVELKEVFRNKTEKRKLVCKVKGFPIPTISWRRRGKVLQQNEQIRIQYKRRHSRLIIKKLDANTHGQYECIAEGVNGQVASKVTTVTDPFLTFSETFSSGNVCDDSFQNNYCQNGGTCYKEHTMGEYLCFCAPDYSGRQCETKQPSHTSMYPQSAIYSCKLGLSTKYYC